MAQMFQDLLPTKDSKLSLGSHLRSSYRVKASFAKGVLENFRTVLVLPHFFLRPPPASFPSFFLLVAPRPPPHSVLVVCLIHEISLSHVENIFFRALNYIRLYITFTLSSIEPPAFTHIQSLLPYIYIYTS